MKGETNSVVTECGHLFHTSCIMKNITRNGFNCPCCRREMAEEVDSDLDSDSDSDSDSDEEEENEIQNLNEEFLAQRAAYELQGLRWFFQRVEGEEGEGIQEEEEEIQIPVQTNNPEVTRQLCPYFISELLKNQGVTYEKLVFAILTEHDEYIQDRRCMGIGGNIWEKIRNILRESHSDSDSDSDLESGYDSVS